MVHSVNISWVAILPSSSYAHKDVLRGHRRVAAERAVRVLGDEAARAVARVDGRAAEVALLRREAERRAVGRLRRHLALAVEAADGRLGGAAVLVDGRDDDARGALERRAGHLRGGGSGESERGGEREEAHDVGRVRDGGPGADGST